MKRDDDSSWSEWKNSLRESTSKHSSAAPLDWRDAAQKAIDEWMPGWANPTQYHDFSAASSLQKWNQIGRCRQSSPFFFPIIELRANLNLQRLQTSLQQQSGRSFEVVLTKMNLAVLTYEKEHFCKLIVGNTYAVAYETPVQVGCLDIRIFSSLEHLLPWKRRSLRPSAIHISDLFAHVLVPWNFQK